MMIDKLIDLVLSCLKLFQFWTVIHEFERGLVLTFGRYKGRELPPGIHWIWPFGVDGVLYDNIVTRTHILNPQSLTTLDGRTISVTAVVTSNVRDIRKALLEVEGVNHALNDACCAAVGAHVAATLWESLRTEPMADALTKACRKSAWRYGIEIERVQLSDLALCRVIRLHTGAPVDITQSLHN